MIPCLTVCGSFLHLYHSPVGEFAMFTRSKIRPSAVAEWFHMLVEYSCSITGSKADSRMDVVDETHAGMTWVSLAVKVTIFRESLLQIHSIHDSCNVTLNIHFRNVGALEN